ncbi:MAG: Gfo/Idh/MocA family oxidoreductase [Blautia sp.]|nr:Gfo/Idh/MocA family oxidoreductase [Blautia sp.]MDY5031800.1 Gfo/Idh/MocA family oxidoreductase [Blautia sp.]
MFKMAILGAGAIAHKMSATIYGMEEVEPYIICDTTIEKAQELADKYGYTKVCSSYEEILADDAVDLVYIALPHSLHYKFTKIMLEGGKNVLCEKSFTVNADQAKEIIALAEEKKLLLQEAIWTRYMPSRKMIDDVIKSGVIGEVTSIDANLGYELSAVPRIWDVNFAGGALLDVGVYMIHFARMIFGDNITDITTSAVFKNGVDMIDLINMTFDDSKMATMQCNVYAAQNRTAAIFGTKGYIEITNINNPEKITVFNDQYEEIACYEVPKQITGYEYEVMACMRALKNGEIECPEAPHSETIKVMEIMDGIRKSWGYEIPLIS